jgi:hypothetical protein
MLFFWYGIASALVPGMTTCQPQRRQPDAYEGAMLCDRFLGVTGTRRIETAVIAQEWAYRITVSTY